MLRLLALTLVVTSSACVSFFQPHAMDVGRGAAPLKPGTLQAHGGVAGGYPGGLAGAGIEGQLSDDLAVGFDVASGAQDSAVGIIVPSGSYLTAQYNPAGWDSLAIRGAAGTGVDVLPNTAATPVAPWLAGTLGVVSSATLGSLEPYLALTLGVRRYVGGPDGPITKVTKVNGTGLVDNQFSGGATVGLRFALGDSLAVYGSGSLAALMLTLDSAGPDAQPTLLPSGNGQLGLSYTF